MDNVRRFRRFLARELPPLRPTVVKITSLPPSVLKRHPELCGHGHDGATIESGWCARRQAYTRFKIYVHPKEDCEARYCEALYHEWAHAVRGLDCEDPHDAKWGIAYAKCQRLYQRFLEGWK